MTNLKEKIQDLPDTPGVYYFKKGKDVLYVGKATSLRDRVRSYFSSDVIETRGVRIVKMVEEATKVDFKETDSVLEALILEAREIKRLEPRYNAIGKDNKSYNYVVITKEDYPRVLLARERELQTVWDPEEIKYTFGPFVSGGQLKIALKIIRKIFPFRGKSDPVERDKKRKSYLNQELGLAPDFSQLTKRDYARTIRNLKLFFEGKKSQLLKSLERDMQKLAKEQKFEEAEGIKRQVFALQHINDIALLGEDVKAQLSQGTGQFRIEAYDVAHIQGSDRVGVMVVVEDGELKKSDYRKFKLKTKEGGDTGGLKEILERRLKHDEWSLPKMIVVDGAQAQINAAEAVLADFGYQIPVVSVVKGAGHKAQRLMGAHKLTKEHEKDILLANSESHRFALAFHRNLRKKQLR